jgi:PAS domain S-box-containing protein
MTDSSNTILVINDREDQILTMVTILQPLGYTLAIATSGEIGLRILLAQAIALVLVDVHMPNMDGFAFAGILRQRPTTADIPIIFVTASEVEDTSRLRGYASGCIDYVHVPVDPAVLRGKVEGLMRMHRLHTDLQCVNAMLEREVITRRQIEIEMRSIHDHLEQRVHERTADLENANAALRLEISERTRVAEALSASEARLKRVINSDILGIMFWEVDGGVTDANDYFLGMIGYSREELIAGSIRWTELTPPEHLVADRLALAEIHVRGACTTYEKEYLRQDGTRLPILIGGGLLPGTGMQGVSFVMDISERRRSEALKDRLANFVESSVDAIFSRDIDGLITSWNPAAETIFGYQVDEIIGSSIHQLIPPERREEESQIMVQIIRGERIDHFETVRLRKDGSRIDVSVTISSLKDSHGRIIGASEITRDISAKKIAELRLKSQLARLDLLNHITRAIGAHQDLQQIFQVVLRTLEERLPIDFSCMCLFDATANELIVTNIGHGGEPLATSLMLSVKSVVPVDRQGITQCVAGQLIYEPDTTAMTTLFHQRLAAGGLRSFVMAPLAVENKVFGVLMVARYQAQGFTSGDCEFLLQLSAHVALAANQNQLHTALQQAYDDLRQSQQGVMLQERLRALGQMASGIAHDISNAITPTVIYVEMLLTREVELSERGRRELIIIQRSVNDVAQTVARLGEFYRQGDYSAPPVAISLNELVPQVVDLTRARWSDMPQQRGIVIDMQADLAADLPAIMGNASEIREALINLVFNAVDAMPKGGTITIRTTILFSVHEETQIQIEVSDSGSGMDEETRQRCLDPFFTTKGENGSGLGLAMVYGIAQRHHAQLIIDSMVDLGTAVRLSFPVSATPAVLDPEEKSVLTSAPQRLLVIDDDPWLLASLRDILIEDGHSVTIAEHGQAGIDIFRSLHGTAEAFTIVITDLGMPHVDGRAVAGAIKALSPTTPVILLTGWGRRLVVEGAIPAHVDHVLSKPPKIQELRRLFARYAAHRSEQQALFPCLP